jgi:murein DD-endopeptidase MepM/ murein hydrolase activator NlpD
MRGWGRRALVLVAPIAIVAWFTVQALVPRMPDRAPIGVATAEPRREIVRDTLESGMALGELMASNGLDAAQIHELTQVIREYKKPRTLRPGIAVRISGPAGERPDRVNVQLNPDSTLRLYYADSVWSGEVQAVPFVVDTVRLSGVIESSLWFAALGGDVARLEENGFQEIVYNLADVFAWKIDFTRDIRKGDAFRLAIERKVRPDGSIRSRQFLGIELRNQNRILHAIPFARPDGRIAYYDDEGRPLRGAFLRYPVPFRITSGFTKRRFHPILKRYRPHQGIDYGAPYGTPVQATARGTVTRAGRWSGYGNAVELRHANGVRTRYAHLSSIGRGIRVGAPVEQGRIVGRVGATGLATGTHLHYEFLQNGKHRNPLAVSVPSEPSLEKVYLGEFRLQRDRALALLEGLAIPRDAVVASAAPAPDANDRQ